MRINKIVYITSSDISSNKANLINSLKMVDAFSCFFNVKFFCYTKKKITKNFLSKILFEYNINKQINFIFCKKKIFNRLRFFLNLFLLIMKEKNETLFYTRDIASSIILCLFKKKNILEIHSLYLKKNFFKTILFQKLIKSKSLILIVSISENLSFDIHNFFKINKNKLITLHDSAEIISKDLYEKYTQDKVFKSNKNNILYCGSFNIGKGLELLQILSNKLIDYNFHILGGTREDAKKKLNLNFGKNVFFYGRINYIETKKFLINADILISPHQEQIFLSKSHDIGRWTSPLKIFEYMSSKKLIVASNTSAIRNILENNIDSILIDPNDISKWINFLRMIFTI